jgi:hypothetical protein
MHFEQYFRKYLSCIYILNHKRLSSWPQWRGRSCRNILVWYDGGYYGDSSALQFMATSYISSLDSDTYKRFQLILCNFTPSSPALSSVIYIPYPARWRILCWIYNSRVTDTGRTRVTGRGVFIVQQPPLRYMKSEIFVTVKI